MWILLASIFSDINKALETLKNGGMIILADNENRENEGDIVTLGETITPRLSISWLVTQKDTPMCPDESKSCWKTRFSNDGGT